MYNDDPLAWRYKKYKTCALHLVCSMSKGIQCSLHFLDIVLRIANKQINERCRLRSPNALLVARKPFQLQTVRCSSYPASMLESIRDAVYPSWKPDAEKKNRIRLTYLRAYKAELTISDGMNSEQYIAQNSGRCEKSRGSDDKQNRKVVGQTFKAIPNRKSMQFFLFFCVAFHATTLLQYKMCCFSSYVQQSGLNRLQRSVIYKKVTLPLPYFPRELLSNYLYRINYVGGIGAGILNKAE